MNVHLFILLCLLGAGVKGQDSRPPVPQGERHPPSPCSQIFSYENDRTWNTRWYGVIVIQSPSPRAFNLEILLDRKADLLGTWSGTVTTDDNERYTLAHPATQNDAAITSFRFFVNFPRGGPVPRVLRIWKDGKLICGGGSTQGPTRPPNRPTGITRPPSRPPNGVSGTGTTRPTARPVVTMLTRPNTRPTGVVTESPVSFPGNSNSGSVVTSEECGTRDQHAVPFFVNGEPTYHGEWPWHVAIYTVIDGNTKYWCGGTLISKRVIVTAGHCITHGSSGRKLSPNQLLVYLGKHNLQESWSQVDGVQTFTPESLVLHPNFKRENLTADIGLIILSHEANITKYVRVICLWPKHEIDIRSIEGDLGTVVGWGFDSSNKPTPELMLARLPVRSFRECLDSNRDFFSRFLTEKTFCAGYRNGTSACNGDSGGGMVMERNQKWHLRAVVSTGVPRGPGSPLCSLEHYSIFVDAAQYVDWIKRNIPTP